MKSLSSISTAISRSDLEDFVFEGRTLKLLLFVLITIFLFLPSLAKADITSGLVGWWTFNGSDITANAILDKSGQGNNGGFFGGPTSSAKVQGKLGQALNFDGSATYVNAGSGASLNITGAVTLCAWEYANDLSGTEIVGNEDATGHLQYSMVLNSGGTGNVSFCESDNTGSPVSACYISDDNVVTAGVWTHICVTRDAADTTGRTYVNGVSANTAKNGGPFTITSSPGPVSIGRAGAGGGSGYYNGKIDDVRVYNRTLSASEVKQIYTHGQSLPKPPNNLGLVGYWPMDEGTGTKAGDFSGNGNNGSFTDLPIWTSGKHGKALQFDGSNDAVTSNDINATDGAAALTISAWIYQNSLSVSRSIVSKFGGGGAENWVFYVNDSDSTRMTFETGGANSDSSAAGRHQAGRWEHWVAVFDASQSGTNKLKFYLNSVLQSDDDSFGSPATAGSNSKPVTIGADPEPGAYFNGKIDDVRIYNRALSASEVANLYGSGLAKIASSADLGSGTSLASGLVGHWTFDGADVTTNLVVDRSGQGNNGGFIGGATSSAKAQGKLGQALRFNNSTTYIDAGDTSSLSLTGSFTLSAWVNPTTITDDDIISKSDGIGNSFSYLMGVNIFDLGSNYEACLVSSDGSTLAIRYSSTILNTRTWYHLTCVYSASAQTLNVYVNGVLDNGTLTGTVPASVLDNTTHVNIGRRPDNLATSYFDGTIDDARVYNRVLTAAEIKQLYNLGQTTLRP